MTFRSVAPRAPRSGSAPPASANRGQNLDSQSEACCSSAGGGWSGWKSLAQPRPGSKVNDITVTAHDSGALVVFATSSVPGSAAGLWFRTQLRAAEPWGDWQEYPLSSGSATTLPVEGPVLTQRHLQLVLLVRETGTANMYVVWQQDPDPGLITSWEWDYAKA